MIKSSGFLMIMLFMAGFKLQAQSDSVHVYVFLSETCPVCKSSTTALNEIYQQFQGNALKFSGYFPSGLSNEQSRRNFARKYKVKYPLFTDSLLIYTRRLHATVTPEVVVMKPADGSIIYRGMIDNSFLSIGRRRQVVTAHYLRDALQQYFESGTSSVTFTEPVGCFIQKSKP
jgi:peroxiredoxin